MEPRPLHYDLLIADLALILELAPARDVAYALQRFWERRAEGASILEELREVARLSDEDAVRLEGEAERLVEAAGGDPLQALGARGGIDRSIHMELSQVAAPLLGELLDAGADMRSPLPVVTRERYLGFQEIGSGGMGVVYMALDSELNRRVALKVVRPERTAEDARSPLDLSPPAPDTPASGAFRTLIARFMQEAVVTGGLEHPGVVPVYELGQTPKGVPYYTMRFVKGERTLEKAIDDAETIEDRLGLLEPFLKVCDTLAYAHTQGVVHRDLKPANVVLGEFGEVVVIDWGLARLRERPDLSRTTWKDRIEEIRETGDLKTLAGGVGTPGYMAPEAVLGKPEDVDERSDVYSLGAILYRILTGRLPYEFESLSELVGKLTHEDPVSPHEADPGVPEKLSRVCRAALARERAGRLGSVRDLSASIRGWQRESAVDREVEGLIHETQMAWAGAEGLMGEGLIRQVDRVLAHALRALEIRPHNPQVNALVTRATAARARAMAERERNVRRRVLRRLAVMGLAVALVAAGAVVLLLDGKRRETEAAWRQATEQRNRAERARDDSERSLAWAVKNRNVVDSWYLLACGDSTWLAELKRDLMVDAEELWPIHPDRASAMLAWMQRVQWLRRSRPELELMLTQIRERALPYTKEDRLRDHAAEFAEIDDLKSRLEAMDEVRHLIEAEPAVNAEEEVDALRKRIKATRARIAVLETRAAERASWWFANDQEARLHGLLANRVSWISALTDGETAPLRTVETRYVLAAGLRRDSIENHRMAWDETIAAIADEGANAAYGGLTIEPIMGLVPLGKDPDSKLYEFAHLGSGTVPARDPDSGRLVCAEDAAIVLVLLPGGTFPMGAQKQDPAGPNYDSKAEPDESPVRDVTVRPFLIAKYECTQAQWAVLTERERPSVYGRGGVWSGQGITDRNPVENVSFDDATLWLTRHRLRLPSEAEWELACRAGTTTQFSFGDNEGQLPDYAWCKENSNLQTHPVGEKLPNRWGIFDMHGNVWELCEDDYEYCYDGAPTDGSAWKTGGSPLRVLRGGCWDGVARGCRSANRCGDQPSHRSRSLGFRPAADLPEVK